MWQPGIGAIEFVIILAIGSIAFLVIPFCCWKIVAKTGYPAWWSLACLIPGATLALLLFLAFSDWPVFDKPVSSANRSV